MLNINSVNAIYNLGDYKYKPPVAVNGKKKVAKFYNFNKVQAQLIITALSDVYSMERNKLLKAIGASASIANNAFRHLLDKNIIEKVENTRKDKRFVSYKLVKKQNE